MNELTVRERPDVSVAASARSAVTYTPRFDIWETDQEIVLSGDMPGVTAEGLEVQFENTVLSIWGKVAPRNENVSYFAQEYGVGDYYRTFALKDVIDGEGIHAELSNGVLTVHLPKKLEARPRRISVKAN